MTDRWQDVSRLYHAALAHEAPTRAAFLQAACVGDETLQHEVESLLAHEEAVADFIEMPALQAAASLGGTQAEAPAMTGGQIGPYKILSLLGVGGMGEVYRARDTKLNRHVAIKVLLPGVANDPDRLARFSREAQILASLNHPHIAQIYGLEDAGGVRALVMELVDGPTLADRIAAGAMPLDEALAIAKQIAQALEAAHEQGIIHRDLKPANIKITPPGVVKVLDFGLAKAAAGDAASGADGSQLSAVTVCDTFQGLILGTPAYMSPEQARGQSVDTRSDIWAFGCVVYQMLTGRVAFPGDTVSDTIAAILEHEPDWEALPAATPPTVRHLLQRCLDKDSTQRLRDIGDARVELERAAAPPRYSRLTSRVVGLNVLGLAVLAGGAGLFYSTRPSAPVTSPSEYVQLTNFTDSAVAPSLSPDGRLVTFIRGGESFLSHGQIYIKVLPNGESVRLTNDDHRKYAPVFTPDGSRITYTDRSAAGWDTWAVPVLGGQPTRLLPNASGLTWITDHQVLFSEIKSGFHMGIVTATEARADSREIYIQPNENAMAHYSYASPDRQSVLVVEMTSTHAFTQPCRLIPFDGSSMGRQVGPQGTCTSTAWSPDGRWMYFGAVVGGSSHLWRQKFPDGEPEQITFGPLEEEGIAMAADGRSLVTSVGMRRSAIWLHDPTGERAISSEGYALLPRLSMDGTRVFYLLARDWWLSTRGWVPASAELRSVDLASGKVDSTLPGVTMADYDLSADEKEVAFTTVDRGGGSQIWLAPLDRRTAPRPVTRAGDQVSFGADGSLVFRSLEEKTNMLLRIRKDGTGQERITTAPILDKYGVSPDGKWTIAFSPLAGVDVGKVLAVPTDGGAARIVCDPPCRAAWSSDGKIFYVSLDHNSASSLGKTFAIPVPAGASLPDLPASGISRAAGEGALRGARVIESVSLSTGPDPSTFVFTKTDLQRNLFRIPLH